MNIPHTFTAVPAVGHTTMDLLHALGESNWEFYRAVFGAKAASTNGNVREKLASP